MVNKVGNVTNACYTPDVEFTLWQGPILHLMLYSPDKDYYTIEAECKATKATGTSWSICRNGSSNS